MRFLDRGGVRLAWDEQGSGTPILLIMGHRYSAGMWYPLKEALGDRYRLISFDNRGTGQSGAPSRTSIEEMTADALAVLDAAGAHTAHIYGVSMGGGIALELGLRHPERVRSLILGCTMAKTPDIERKPDWLIKLVYNAMPLLKLFAKPKFKNGYGDAAPDDLIARDMKVLASDPYELKGVIAQALAISHYSVDPEEVRAMELPTLVLHGTQDLAVPYEAGKAMAEMIPGARFVTFQDIGHNYFIGAGERANAEMERFIGEVEAARTGA